MKKNNMILCAAILFTCYIIFPRLLKKQGSKYPKWWDREADEALEQVKNFLQETK
jgi:hypothetical protein